eukprot:12154768-Ditylum_brightwellii.AAC.1
MANRKAPGPSGVTSNALNSMVWTEKNLEDEHANDNDDYLATIIHAMIVEFWEGTLDCESWKYGTLAPVPKRVIFQTQTNDNQSAYWRLHTRHSPVSLHIGSIP